MDAHHKDADDAESSNRLGSSKQPVQGSVESVDSPASQPNYTESAESPALSIQGLPVEALTVKSAKKPRIHSRKRLLKGKSPCSDRMRLEDIKASDCLTVEDSKSGMGELLRERVLHMAEWSDGEKTAVSGGHGIPEEVLFTPWSNGPEYLAQRRSLPLQHKILALRKMVALMRAEVGLVRSALSTKNQKVCAECTETTCTREQNLDRFGRKAALEKAEDLLDEVKVPKLKEI